MWAYIGLNSFGGPAGQIAVMHRELVERRNWLSERRFIHALNFCMVLPGPEAQQLATYIGWLMHGTVGGVIAGTLFIIPGFVAMLTLSIGYVLFGEVTWVQGLLFGLQAAVVAIVLEALIRIGRRTLRSRGHVVTAVLSFAAITWAQVPFPVIIVAAGLTGWLLALRRPGDSTTAPVEAHSDPRKTPTLLSDDESISEARTRSALRAAVVCALLWLVPTALLILVLGDENVFAQEATLFSKSAVLTFGGAYAVLGYLTQEAVSRYGWITPKDMITGLGLAETTPGPLVMVVQFVGFLAAYNHPGSLPPLVAGMLGAVLAVWVTFVPCFMFIFLGAPYIERLRHSTSLTGALSLIGAAVTGVILNLAVWFFLHTTFGRIDDFRIGPLRISLPALDTVNPSALAICALAALLVFRFRVRTISVLGACAVIGMVVTLAIDRT